MIDLFLYGRETREAHFARGNLRKQECIIIQSRSSLLDLGYRILRPSHKKYLSEMQPKILF